MVLSADPSPRPSSANNVINGTPGEDVLSGYSGNDRLYGGARDDLFQEGRHVWQVSSGEFVAGTAYDLGQGDDFFDGGAGVDLLSVGGTARAGVLDLTAGTLVRGTETDRFTAVEAFELGAGADLVVRLKSNLLIDTSGGNDTVVGLVATVFVDGGAGLDTLDLRRMTEAVNIDELSFGLHNGSYIRGFEHILGAAGFANAIGATAGNDTVIGGRFGDTLHGQSGNDVLEGQRGDDRLDGGLGRDTIYGGSGQDSLSAVDGENWLYGGAGNDTLNGGLGISRLEDRLGANLFVLLTGQDTVIAGALNDTVMGGVDAFSTLGQSVINTGLGDDFVQLTSGRTQLLLKGGNDEATIGHGSADGGTGNDTLTIVDFGTLSGGDGDDVLFGAGSSPKTWLYGGAGNDRLEIDSGDGGRTVADGGAGDDVFVVGQTETFITANLSGGTGIDRFEIAKARDVTISGGIENTTVIAADIYTLNFNGGAGVDQVLFSRAGPEYGRARLGDGDDAFRTADPTNLADPSSFTSHFVLLAGAGNDSLNSWAQSIYADEGNDTIRSISDLTDIFGGSGDDLILLDDAVWFENSDIGNIFGGAGQDHARLGLGRYELHAAGDTGLPQGYGRAVFGVEVIEFVRPSTYIADFAGTDFNLGNGNDEVGAFVAGHIYDLGTGNDSGLAGADDTTILGGAGNDYLYAEDHVGILLYGGVGNDVLSGIHNAGLFGGAGDDTINLGLSFSGWTGDQLAISAGVGDDLVNVICVSGWIDLGDGADHLILNPDSLNLGINLEVTTGAGPDSLDIWTTGLGTITISDFDPGEDRLSLQGIQRVRDFDSYANSPDGLTLVKGDLTIILAGLRVNDVPADAFDPL